MNKLFIVDDEEMERESLCEFCNWNDLNIQITGTARNGEMALEKIKNEKPDIIITDVKMPVMDGLELAREAKKLYPDIKIIFISGYDDFFAAREAIRLKASAYLLKPVNISELFNTVYNIINQSIKEKFRNEENENLQKRLVESIPLVRDSFIRDLILGIKEYGKESFLKRAKYVGINPSEGKYCLLLVTIHNVKRSGEQTEEAIQKKILIALESAREAIKDHPESYAVQVHDDEICVLMRMSDILEENDTHLIIDGLATQMLEGIKAKIDIPVSIGVSSVSNNIMALRTLYKQSKMAAAQRIFQDKSGILFYESHGIDPGLTKFPDTESLKSSVEEALWTADRNKINRLIDEYFDKLREAKCADIDYIKSVCLQMFGRAILSLHETNEGSEKKWIKKLFDWDSLKKIETLAESKKHVKSVLTEIVDSLFVENMDEKFKIVHKTKKYISENYGQPISIDEISSALFLSSGYISRVFKNSTGITIQEYVTSYRMEKACGLLKNTNKKITDIANSVGYDNSSYFGSIFKSAYNMTPGEYKRRAEEKKENEG